MTILPSSHQKSVCHSSHMSGPCCYLADLFQVLSGVFLAASEELAGRLLLANCLLFEYLETVSLNSLPQKGKI